MLTSALTKSTFTVDRSTRLVGSASLWAPQVSLSLETYRWDPCVRVKLEKEKKKAFRFVGLEKQLGRLLAQLGSAHVVGSARPAACRPARTAARGQKGRLRSGGLNAKGPARLLGPLVRMRPVFFSPFFFFLLLGLPPPSADEFASFGGDDKAARGGWRTSSPLCDDGSSPRRRW